ncbi:RNA methyltransferase [Sphingomonas daechungensis]|uniref:RNA methyltransferase n=1 Tax=Sphingomonas daechungensis TaxID=1176646 RepID=UPI0037840E67
MELPHPEAEVSNPVIAPTIVLVRPQLAENIGTAARAMLNCGLTEMRLVRPRCSLPDERASRAASGADAVLEQAGVYADVVSAVADMNLVFATCPRERDMAKPVITPQSAIQSAREAMSAGAKVAFLFGAERTGLENDEVTLADAMVPFPVNPDFNSLNLAQAVLLVGWEWARAHASPPQAGRRPWRGELATKVEVDGFLTRLEAELDSCGFLRNPAMRPAAVRNLRAFFLRARPNAQEIRTAHGILTGLVERPHAGKVGKSRPGRHDPEA